MSTEKENTSKGNLNPILHPGEYVFCCVSDIHSTPLDQILLYFKEEKGYTIVLSKMLADSLHLEYTYIAAWITLRITTDLQMVGLTARFSTALAKVGISCNVVAAYHHDHVFVEYKDGESAMEVLVGIML